MNKRVLLVYFSGTGGTRRIADTFEETFIRQKCTVTKHSLDKTEYHAYKEKYEDLIKKSDLIVLLFPVYILGAPLNIYKWIEDLKDGKNKSTVVISVSGGGNVWPNTSCRVNVIKALEKKHYNVVYEKMMVMPANVLVKYNDHLVMHLLKCVPEKVNKMVNDLLDGKKRRDGLHIGTYIFSLLHTDKAANGFGKSFRTKDTCSGCGWCVKNCPQGNLKLENGKPISQQSCVACLRCFYGCPNKAIYFQNGQKAVLKDGFNIEEVEKRMKDAPLEPVEKCCRGIAFIGIKKYLLGKD